MLLALLLVRCFNFPDLFERRVLGFVMSAYSLLFVSNAMAIILIGVDES